MTAWTWIFFLIMLIDLLRAKHARSVERRRWNGHLHDAVAIFVGLQSIEGHLAGAELAGWKGGARPTLSFGRLA
jgi:hypothetical protein